MSRNLDTATEGICGQLTRYGCVANEKLADVLDEIVEINDDIHNGRHVTCIEKSVLNAKRLLDELLKE